MISALWSNPNFDSQESGKEAPRKEAIEDIEKSFAEAVQMITTGVDPNVEVETEDPFGFFDAGKRGQDKILANAPAHLRTVKDVVDYSEFIDQ